MKAEYIIRLGQIISTTWACKPFGDAMGTDVINLYNEIFGAG